MITIINGTNRSNNLSQVISTYYRDIIVNLGEQDVHYISMEHLPDDIISSMMFTSDGRSTSLTKMQDEIIIPSEKILFILPEYNGGIPGILKLFIDACSSYKGMIASKERKLACSGLLLEELGTSEEWTI